MPQDIVLNGLWNHLLPDKFKQRVTDPSYLKGMLLGSYGQPSRLYHNVAHLYNMLSEAKKGLQCTDEFYAAVLFHDIVYDIQSPKGWNEEASFLFFQENAQGLFNPPLDAEHVERLIMATKHDSDLTVGAPLGTPPHLDKRYEEKLIVDLDLSGFQRASYINDHIAVAAEYVRGGYTVDQVLQGRLLFLNAFIQREPFYYLDLFDVKCAKDNLQNLIWDVKREIKNQRAENRRNDPAWQEGRQMTLQDFRKQKSDA